MTVFVRFAGCNMRCPGWPCDTPYAIEPSIWRHEAEKLGAHEVALRARVECEENAAVNVCFTGGEPFMQPHEDLREITRIVMAHGIPCEVFTNGSYIFPEWAFQTITFMMDWKLTGSGEAMNHRAQRYENARRLKVNDGIKFVVKDVEDLDEAARISSVLETRAQFWVGAAWGHIRDVDIVDYIKHNRLPWRLNVQTHKHIWEPTLRGV